MIRTVRVDEAAWPVDVSTDDEDSAQWVLRYGTTSRREVQRLSVASILSAYAALIDPRQTMKDATAMLRRARAAAMSAEASG